ncbi:MAG: DNA translocase FtsK, partial [Clostridia bacterium]|nr:DNA translocase FtsK [Clostridia bacterium]
HAGSVGEGIPATPAAAPRGHGRLVVQCGWELRRTVLSTAAGANASAFAPLRLPCLLDLLKDRGFVTDSPSTIRSFLLRLLHLLPAGSLTLSVYDPKGMGDFVKYLYPLGDGQEKVLGTQGVLSTPNQLQHLLEATERHIGIINQKYLAGKHPDLVAYNLDAGVSFEPYRLLVIHDDPAAWAANYRQELVAQLGRIAAAGPHCGVFVIVCTAQPCAIGLPVLKAGGSDLPALTQKAGKALPCQTIEAKKLMMGSGMRSCWQLTETVTWQPEEPSRLSPAGELAIVQQLEQALSTAEAVEVSPEGVSEAARLYREGQLKKGIRFGPPVVAESGTAGWWGETSTEGLFAYVGLEKANQKKPCLMVFRGTPSEFGALVGGQSRSGKSTFLHTLILELVRRYPPEELELYLVDVKFGAEFKHYASARLPHARVIALASGAEFALSVLEELVAEMERRYAAFKLKSVSKIDDYRKATGKGMPRVLAILDEFSGIFESDGPLADRATLLLTRLIQQGSAAGVHLVLAAQSLSTAPAIPRQVLPQIPMRVVFKVPEQDSRMLLADDNPEAASLDRPGEGLFNRSNGRKGANEGFQGTLTTHDHLKAQLKQLAAFAQARGVKRRPVILESMGATRWTAAALKKAKEGRNGLALTLPLGLPLSLADCVTAPLEQTVGGNLLACLHDGARRAEFAANLTLSALLAGAQAAVLDFGGTGDPFAARFAPYEAAFAARRPGALRVLRGTAAYEMISRLKQRIDRAIDNNEALSRPLLLVITGLAQAVNLNQLSPAAMDFDELLARGAAAGLHVVLAADALGTVKSRLGYSWHDRFSVFVTGPCSADDSMELTGARTAASLDSEEQLVVCDSLRGRVDKVRPFLLASIPLKT